MKNKLGKFITFEGLDGSGKTTQIRLLKNFFKKQGKNVFLSREPGGTGVKFAEAIRRLILHPNYIVHPRSELLLYEASRAQHVEKSIRPMIKQGYWVLCDRFTDATLAYQGGGRSIPIKELLWLNKFATDDLKPDLTIFLDISLKEGLRKARNLSQSKNKKDIYSNGDRLEREKLDFHRRVQHFYRRMVNEYPRIRRVSVEKSIEKTHAKIVNIVLKKWPVLKKAGIKRKSET